MGSIIKITIGNLDVDCKICEKIIRRIQKNQERLRGTMESPFVGLPKEGETLHGNKFIINYGGKGANQCTAAQKLGGDTTMIARVGDDIWGDKYIKNLMDLGINYQYVKKTPNFSSGIAQISVADNGTNQIIIVAGANSQLSVLDIKNTKDIIENAAVIVCQLETPPVVAIAAMKLCKGISILNGAPAMDNYNLELITLPSIFCVNELEASVFSGITVITIGDAKAAIKILLEKGCKSVIITMGSQGAVFASQEQYIPIHIRTSEIECVDSTGAGDAFIGCLAYLLANYKNLPLKCSIDIACFIASESCKQPGTQSSFPSKCILDEYVENRYSSYL